MGVFGKIVEVLGKIVEAPGKYVEVPGNNVVGGTLIMCVRVHVGDCVYVSVEGEIYLTIFFRISIRGSVCLSILFVGLSVGPSVCYEFFSIGQLWEIMVEWKLCVHTVQDTVDSLILSFFSHF